jgi:hypothetical protein
MAGACKLYLTFYLTAISNEPLELGMWNLAYRMSINCVLNITSKLTIKNMATVRIFGVILCATNLKFLPTRN